jgi:hypothetical protein
MNENEIDSEVTQANLQTDRCCKNSSPVRNPPIRTIQNRADSIAIALIAHETTIALPGIRSHLRKPLVFGQAV